MFHKRQKKDLPEEKSQLPSPAPPPNKKRFAALRQRFNDVARALKWRNIKDAAKRRYASLRQEFNNTFRGLQWKDGWGVTKETVKDLRHPKEMLKLTVSAVAGIVMPGGWIGYVAYRIHHYRKVQKAANDNTPPKIPAAPDPKPPTP